MKGVKICEGEFAGTVSYPTKKEFEAYAAGFNAGGDNYGAGSCAVYTRDDLEDLDPEDPHDREKISLIKKHL